MEQRCGNPIWKVLHFKRIILHLSSFCIFEANQNPSTKKIMPEIIQDKKIFTLLEVSKSIKQTLADRYQSSFWVKAEMNKLNLYRLSGNCYPELVEKRDGKIIAQLKGQLWKDDYYRANANFLKLLQEPLKDGIKILFLAKISYDPSHGLALSILDIDPSYTLGDLEREKQESIQRLKQEGLFNRNKNIPMPLLPQRIAIISVDSSKGYVDFMQVLQNNPYKYAFFHLLFPSLLQGDQAVPSIIKQLKRIEKVKHHFDVVAIIRGGGGDVGLSCYNHYQLAKEIASFPIPVITGIGHATNETVSEMISHTNAITPTKLAEYLIQYFNNFNFPVQEAQKKINAKAKQLLADEQATFLAEIKLFRSLSEGILQGQSHSLHHVSKTLVQQAQYVFKNQHQALNACKQELVKGSKNTLYQHKEQCRQWQNKGHIQIGLNLKTQALLLQNIEKNIDNMNPKNVLKRGFSIVRINGSAIHSTAQVKPGDTLQIEVYDGHINSTVNKPNKTQK